MEIEQPEKKTEIDTIAKTEPKNVKRGRIIIRNLVFDIHENHLRQLLSKYGEIVEVQIPMNATTNTSRGFAFVNFSRKTYALKAIKELNGKLYKGRKIILDLSVPKDQYQNAKASVKEGGENAEVQNQESESEEPAAIAPEEKKQEEEEEVKKVVVQKKAPPKEKKREEENLDCTIFVRNISFQTSEAELKEFFSRHGELHFVKLVQDKETGTHKGTAFAKFKEPEPAQRLIEASQQREENGIRDELVDLELSGRRLIVFPALQRSTVADKKKAEAEARSEKGQIVDLKKVRHLEELIKADRQGKRNLHLALLGIYSPDDEGLSAHDVEVRKQHLKEKIEKLKNPNMKISQTRVNIRCLPKKNFEEKELKDLVKAILSEAYTENQLKKMRIVKQILILRDEPVPSESGEQASKDSNGVVRRSKGIAFVEFWESETAKAFVEKITELKHQVAAKLPNHRIPLVEFCVEDARKIAKLQDSLKKHKEVMKEMQQGVRQEKRDRARSASTRNAGSNAATKIQIEQIVSEQNSSKIEELKKLVEQIRGRGLKQRAKKKIEKIWPGTFYKVQKVQRNSYSAARSASLGQVNESKTKSNENVPQKQKTNEQVRQKYMEAKKQSEIETRQQFQKIKSEIHLKRKARQDRQNHDEFDELAEKHLSKAQKKIKWSER